jgi:hypothetical protein
MPLELLPAAVREEISIAYGIRQPRYIQLLAKAIRRGDKELSLC